MVERPVEFMKIAAQRLTVGTQPCLSMFLSGRDYAAFATPSIVFENIQELALRSYEGLAFAGVLVIRSRYPLRGICATGNEGMWASVAFGAEIGRASCRERVF